MANEVENDIDELIIETDQLIGQAGFALRSQKGFVLAVDLIKRNIAVMKKINTKIDDIIEITKNQGIE